MHSSRGLGSTGLSPGLSPSLMHSSRGVSAGLSPTIMPSLLMPGWIGYGGYYGGGGSILVNIMILAALSYLAVKMLTPSSGEEDLSK